MALILLADEDLTTILDKLAWYALLVRDAYDNAASDVLTDEVLGLAGFILILGDIAEVADLLPPARKLLETPPALEDRALMPLFAAMFAGLNEHYRLFGLTSLDAYLTSINTPTPTLRAHGAIRQYMGVLAAANSFIPADLTLATLTATGATTGTFTAGATIDTTKYAGAKLVVKNVTALNSDMGVTVTGKKRDGTSASLTATLTTHTQDQETDLDNTDMVFTQVTAIAITNGTSDDVISILAKTDRDVTGA
jgi:hypothetical protein